MGEINWQEWNKETFEKAAKENKPILVNNHPSEMGGIPELCCEA